MGKIRLLRVTVVFGAACGLVVASASTAAVYHVRPGDTLTGIASRYRTTVKRLEHLNRLAPTAPLLAGATLRLPGPAPILQRYLVAPGDTLTAIAERFHTTVTAIAAASGIQPARPILIGSTLRVPVRARARPPAADAVYRVRAGDTLSGIALRYRVSLGNLIELNQVDPSAPLLVGTRLALPPGAALDAPATATTPSVRSSIVHWARHYGVKPRLATALAWMESGFNNRMVSPAGAVGVMQVTPATWDYVEQVLLLGRHVPRTADGNVRIGVAYLHHLLHLYDGDQRKALAAYYQGPRSLQNEGLLPGTDQYVADILALEQRI